MNILPNHPFLVSHKDVFFYYTINTIRTYPDGRNVHLIPFDGDLGCFKDFLHGHRDLRADTMARDQSHPPHPRAVLRRPASSRRGLKNRKIPSNYNLKLHFQLIQQK